MTGEGVPSFQEAVWRYVQPRLGKAWIGHRFEGKPRPGVVVTVTRITHERMCAQVETDWGLDRRMFCHQLDFGYEFRTRGGVWLPENDPRSLRWLMRVRQELAAGKPPRHVGDYNHRLDEPEVLRILRRNGCDPDKAVSARERRRRGYLGDGRA